MIQAVWYVNTGKKVYVPGEEIPAKALSKEDKKELLEKGAIEEIAGSEQEADEIPDNDENS